MRARESNLYLKFLHPDAFSSVLDSLPTLCHPHRKKPLLFGGNLLSYEVRCPAIPGGVVTLGITRRSLQKLAGFFFCQNGFPHQFRLCSVNANPILLASGMSRFGWSAVFRPYFINPATFRPHSGHIRYNGRNEDRGFP